MSDPNPQFDVFLSHNSRDKSTVRRLGTALKRRGLTVWLDEWELIPGRAWHDAVEVIIKTTKSAVVIVGENGLGPWEQPEMRACLNEFVKRKLPVIPVLLPNTPHEPDLPLFLQTFTWVDLRKGLTKAGLDRLEWGITGAKPVTSTEPIEQDSAFPTITKSQRSPLKTTTVHESPIISYPARSPEAIDDTSMPGKGDKTNVAATLKPLQVQSQSRHFRLIKKYYAVIIIFMVVIGSSFHDYLSNSFAALPVKQARLLAFETSHENGRFMKFAEKADLSFGDVRAQTVGQLDTLTRAVEASEPSGFVARLFTSRHQKNMVAAQVREVAKSLEEIEENELDFSDFKNVAGKVSEIFRLSQGDFANSCQFSATFEDELRRSLRVSRNRLKGSLEYFELSMQKEASHDDLVVIAASSCEDCRDMFLGLCFIMFSDGYRDRILPSSELTEIVALQEKSMGLLQQLQDQLTSNEESIWNKKIGDYVNNNRHRMAVIEKLINNDLGGAARILAAK